ncbi:MAG TPA: hypothetical protein VK029_08945 [Pseudogracilibacillus sp.]|nr:hypothetical protein [Pseudogracilibacillus sp.]
MPEGLPDINLLPQYERHSGRSFYAFIIFFLLIVLSFVLIGVFYFTTKSKLVDVEAQLDELATRAEQLQIELAALETDGSSSIETAVTFANQNTYLTSILIEETVDLLPDHSYVKEFDYDVRETNITAHFERMDRISQYTTDLTTSNVTEDVKVNEIDTFELKEEMIEGEEILFDVIPRYELHMSVQVNKDALKEAEEQDE